MNTTQNQMEGLQKKEKKTALLMLARYSLQSYREKVNEKAILGVLCDKCRRAVLSTDSGRGDGRTPSYQKDLKTCFEDRGPRSNIAESFAFMRRAFFQAPFGLRTSIIGTWFVRQAGNRVCSTEVYS